jgi:RimJ/RimL family protein N-acetyltransferase
MPTLTDYFVKEASKDGREIVIRTMRPDDKERIVNAFVNLQPHTIRMRFFYAKKSLKEDELRWLEEIGHGSHVGLAATVPRGREELIIGEGSYAACGRMAEIGFTVVEAWQGRGIASRLLQHLASIARDRGIDRFEAYVLKGNEPMLAVFRHSGFAMTTREDLETLHVTLLLDSPAAMR